VLVAKTAKIRILCVARFNKLSVVGMTEVFEYISSFKLAHKNVAMTTSSAKQKEQHNPFWTWPKSDNGSKLTTSPLFPSHFESTTKGCCPGGNHNNNNNVHNGSNIKSQVQQQLTNVQGAVLSFPQPLPLFSVKHI